MSPGIVALLVLLLIASIVLAIICTWHYIRMKYTGILEAHSLALRTLDEIQAGYDYADIPIMDMGNCYDNEDFYDEITCLDYLTYELVTCQKEVLKACRNAESNRLHFEAMLKEIQSKCRPGEYDEEIQVRFPHYLARVEEKLIAKRTLKPQTRFTVIVNLYLTYMNGNVRGRKYEEFNAGEIINVIRRINQKRGTFYLDRAIYDSLVRVERGKVTNKMRFAIYARDGYRCRKCGRATDDLEIDHIIPISKGGKSTMDNLQTLCHECNQRKGSKIE